MLLCRLSRMAQHTIWKPMVWVRFQILRFDSQKKVTMSRKRDRDDDAKAELERESNKKDRIDRNSTQMSYYEEAVKERTGAEVNRKPRAEAWMRESSRNWAMEQNLKPEYPEAASTSSNRVTRINWYNTVYKYWLQQARDDLEESLNKIPSKMRKEAEKIIEREGKNGVWKWEDAFQPTEEDKLVDDVIQYHLGTTKENAIDVDDEYEFEFE